MVKNKNKQENPRYPVSLTVNITQYILLVDCSEFGEAKEADFGPIAGSLHYDE